jgi:uncharacterized protein
VTDGHQIGRTGGIAAVPDPPPRVECVLLRQLSVLPGPNGATPNAGLVTQPGIGPSVGFPLRIAYTPGMDREQVIATLRAHEPELRHRGIRHAALFGSVVRGEARPSSDIDLLIELDPEAPIGVFEYVELTDFIGGLFPVRVDVANRAGPRPHVRSQAEREAVQAF